MGDDVSARADMGLLRYAQCWEDADTLLAALDPAPGSTLVSIASAGDNSLSLLTTDPARVIAIDLSPAQLAATELRAAMYRRLEHAQMLELVGSRASERRLDLYRVCRDDLSAAARGFWDARPTDVRAGVGAAGRFERYLAMFRTRILPLIHGRAKIDELLLARSLDERRRFYDATWDTWRWRGLFRLFFSRAVMGRVGRDPAFFDHVEGSVADRILARTRHALTEIDTTDNPYLHWILKGTHGAALPHALREENFAHIRENLDRLEWRLQPLEELAHEEPPDSIDGFNLSDVFEYMPPASYHQTLDALVRAGRSGARLAYWNLLAPRRRPESMAARLTPLRQLSSELHARDKAWFYSDLVVEEVA